MEQTTFTDSDGVLWSVREDGWDDTHSVSSDPSPGAAWLRFESELEVRRLWHYPDDWRGLSPIQLESLLDRASTVIARFRPAPHRPVDVNARRDVGDTPSPERRSSPERADSPLADPHCHGDTKR
jgi:hypothetical protein